MTNAEALLFLQSCFPAGSEQLYDLSSTANVGKLLTLQATTLRTYGFDYLDILRAEVNPTTCTQKIPDWEAALGLTGTSIARFGTTAQRRNAIIGKLRESGSFSIPDIQAAVQPFFLYSDPSTIAIIETPRGTLTTQHLYLADTGFAVAPNDDTLAYLNILDDPRISPAGVTLYINLDCTNIEQLRMTVRNPDLTAAGSTVKGDLGTGAVVGQTFVLRFKDGFLGPIGGHVINGQWVVMVDCDGGAGCTVNTWGLFVEGLGVNHDGAMPPNRIGEGLGAAMFYWAVIADESKLGTGYDLTGAYRTLQRIKPAHTQVAIIWRAIGQVDNCAIPDTRSATPEAAIPCS